MAKLSQQLYEFGQFRLDTNKRILLRDGNVIPITPKSFETLLALVESSGELVSKDKLIERVWPDSIVEDGNLTYNISILRKILGERAGEHQYIVTIPGHGYQFVAAVRQLSNGNGVISIIPEQPADKETAPTDSFIIRPVRYRRWIGIALILAVIAAGCIVAWLYKSGGMRSNTGLPADAFQKMKMTRLTTSGDAGVAAISPDGKYVAHSMGARNKQSLWLRHIATDSEKEIVPPARVGYSALNFSPDGNYIYFMRVEVDDGMQPLYRVPVLGGLVQKLGNDIDSGVSFSPDGLRIAYMRGLPEQDASLFLIANADGTDEQTLLTKSPLMDVFPAGPQWSPNGEVIVFGMRKDGPNGKYYNLMTVRVTDRVEQQLTFQKWSTVAGIAWLSDGSGLVVVAAAEEGYQIWHVAYPSGEVRRITNDTSEYDGVTLTANSKSLVTVRTERDSNIWMAPGGDSSRAVQVTTSNLDGIGGISCSTDGRVVYATSARGSSHICIVSADGTNLQLTDGAFNDFSPSVTPDGRYVVFSSNRSGKRCIWRIDIDGSNPKQLTYDDGARSVSLSPDGKWIVYPNPQSGIRMIWKVSIDGDTPVQLTDYYATGPSVSPDGKQISVFFLDEQVPPKRRRVGIIPFDGGPPIKIFDFPQPTGQTVRWTSDGRALTYLDVREGAYNIWAQPLDGGAPRQLTNFTMDRIFSYAWSPDGKLLACSGGNTRSDVVLIEAIR